MKENKYVKLTNEEYKQLLKDSTNYKTLKNFVKNKDEHLAVINFINFLER